MKNYKPYFEKVLHKRFPEDHPGLLATLKSHYHEIARDTAFALTSSNPIDRRLDFTAYFLALIKTLDGKGISYDTIREICLEITLDYVRPANWLQAWLKKLPPKLINTGLANIFLRAFDRRVSHNDNPGGFVARIITDKDETYGFGYGIDILECGICKLFNKHHYEKFASILCEVDEVTSSLAGLKLIRNGTIARGAHKCDFRFKKSI